MCGLGFQPEGLAQHSLGQRPRNGRCFLHPEGCDRPVPGFQPGRPIVSHLGVAPGYDVPTLQAENKQPFLNNISTEQQDTSIEWLPLLEFPLWITLERRVVDRPNHVLEEPRGPAEFFAAGAGSAVVGFGETTTATSNSPAAPTGTFRWRIPSAPDVAVSRIRVLPQLYQHPKQAQAGRAGTSV
jgi:hypothetical protein